VQENVDLGIFWERLRMDNILDIVLQYMQLMQPVGMVFAIIGLIVMGIACFAGYRLQKVWIAIIGFALGAFGGWKLATIFVDNSVIEMLIAVIAGFFIAVLAVCIHKLGVFLMCAFFGFALSAAVLSAFMAEPMSVLAIAGTVGFAMGVLGVIFTKPVIIIVSAFYGGIKIADFIMMILAMKVFYYLLVGGCIIAIIGLAVQFFTTRHYTLDRSGDRKSEY